MNINKEQKEKLENELKEIEEKLKSDPHNSKLLYQKGNILEKLGRYYKAYIAYSLAYNYNPKMKEANIRKETLRHIVDREFYLILISLLFGSVVTLFYATLPEILNLSSNLKTFVLYSYLIFLIIIISTMVFISIKRSHDELKIRSIIK